MTLQEEVTNKLVTTYDFLIEEAEEVVSKSYASEPQLWTENASVSDLANMLATGEDDE